MNLSPASTVEIQADTVRLCLDRIVKSPEFRASGRAKQLLTSVVERTLEGRQGEIKERTIAMEVFGRSADFEPTEDAIVRVSANEVRRRLTQYYADAGQADPVRIGLPHGSYVPEFEWTPPAVPSAAPAVSLSFMRVWLRRWPILAGIAVAVVALEWWILAHNADPLDRFWAPVAGRAAQPVLCLPDSETFQSARLAVEWNRSSVSGRELVVPPAEVMHFRNWHVSLPVTLCALNVSSLLARKGREPIVRIGADLRADELRGRPLIAIGSFSNPFVKQQGEGLRFTFDRGPSDSESPKIRDQRNPNRAWSLSSTYPATQDRDYAIVTRTFDEHSGAMFVSLAGLHSFGCQIAGEFVSDASLWNEFARTAPKGWERMNLQIVLESRVVGTAPSAPKILDTYFWNGTEPQH